MKRGWWLILLLSVGLNLGLGYRLWTLRGEGDRWAQHRGREFRDRQHPPRDFAPQDSVRWRTMADSRLAALDRRLVLSPDQRAAFREIHQGQGSLIRENRLAVEELRGRLHQMMGRPDLDQPTIRATIQELGRRQAELDSLVTETVMLELQILSPEQRERYRRMMPFESGPRPRGRRRGNADPRGQ